MSKSVNEHQDPLIEETFALLQRARDEQLNTALPVVQFGMVETKVVLATERSDEQTASLASLSVEILASSEQAPSPTAAVGHPNPDPSPPRQTVEDLRSDPLIVQTLSMVQTVSVVNPEPAISPSLLRPAAKVLSPKERLDMERADMRRRVAVFKETQKRFQREFRIGWSKNGSAIAHPMRRRVADKRHDNFRRGAAADDWGDFLHNSFALFMLDSETIELGVPHLHIRLCPAYEAA